MKAIPKFLSFAAMETCFAVHFTCMCVYSRVKQDAINQVIKVTHGRCDSLMGSSTVAASKLILSEMAENGSNGQIGYNWQGSKTENIL